MNNKDLNERCNPFIVNDNIVYIKEVYEYIKDYYNYGKEFNNYKYYEKACYYFFGDLINKPLNDRIYFIMKGLNEKKVDKKIMKKLFF